MGRAVFAAISMFVLLVLSSSVWAAPAENAQMSRSEIKNEGTQAMIDKGRVESFLSGARNELEQNILQFWIRYCQDNEYGGFIGRMSNDRSVVKDAPKGLVLNARILWTFSAAYRFEKNDEYLKMAKRSFDYIMQYFWDKQFGGAYWLLDHTGKAVDDSKEVYGQSFLIYGLSEYYLASGDKAALEKAKELFNLIEMHCHDDVNRGYFETFKRDWSATEKARLASGDAQEKKTMNTHLHLLEAYTNLYRVWKDQKLRMRLKELIAVFQEHIINAETFHFKLFFDEQWHSTKDIISFGHDIEGSWLLCEAAEVLGDEHITKQIQLLALKMAQTIYEQGFDTDGGLFYEAQGGRITNAQKDWWPQAEAVIGLINAYQLSKQERFFEGAERSWLFIREHIADSEYGEWLWNASPNGKPDKGALKVSEWKGPYHNGRACLEVIRRLQEIEK
ncbi:MAG: AGE family epimerase/isomerase [Sedimentisphaerales bacterium]